MKSLYATLTPVNGKIHVKFYPNGWKVRKKPTCLLALMESRGYVGNKFFLASAAMN